LLVKIASVLSLDVEILLTRMSTSPQSLVAHRLSLSNPDTSALLVKIASVLSLDVEILLTRMSTSPQSLVAHRLSLSNPDTSAFSAKMLKVANISTLDSGALLANRVSSMISFDINLSVERLLMRMSTSPQYRRSNPSNPDTSASLVKIVSFSILQRMRTYLVRSALNRNHNQPFIPNCSVKTRLSTADVLQVKVRVSPSNIGKAQDRHTPSLWWILLAALKLVYKSPDVYRQFLRLVLLKRRTLYRKSVPVNTLVGLMSSCQSTPFIQASKCDVTSVT
jgi:hypothetical protein